MGNFAICVANMPPLRGYFRFILGATIIPPLRGSINYPSPFSPLSLPFMRQHSISAESGPSCDSMKGDSAVHHIQIPGNSQLEER